MAEKCDLCVPAYSPPDPTMLVRTANRHRQKFRPQEQKDLNFKVRKYSLCLYYTDKMEYVDMYTLIILM
jgi:hypothetical protein